MSIDEMQVPVVIAGGHAIEREAIVTTEDLCERAARAALDAAPRLADRIQRVSVVSTVFSPSSPRGATELGERLGLAAGDRETSTVGGNTPQWLVTRAAEQISRGELAVTLLAGAESTRSARSSGEQDRLFRRREELADVADPVVGASSDGMLSAAEMVQQLWQPAHVYPLFESAMAARAGRTFAEQRAFLGRMLAPFTEAAARHPYAWFRDTATPDELATPTPENRVTAEPYTKRMNAFPNVDLGAALIVCSLAEARRAGLADRAVFVWSGADAAEVLAPTARPHLASSPGIAAATSRALEAAGVGVDDIARFDFYSCFPSAVQAAAEAVGIAVDDRRGLTVTGGLPYFGGPGNNYPMHSIATMIDLLRSELGLALVTGLGGFITKHAAGIYGSEPPPAGFRRGDTSADQRAIDASAIPLAVDDAAGGATVDASTVVYASDGSVESVPVIARLDDGRRVAAKAHPGELAGLAGQSLVGARIQVDGSPATFRVESEPALAGR
ncbi:MAG TPA: hypothetical protein VM262_02560 [Acidimicrobiales bacterium]|nr:hypothetical protein [Acidimicrobiales bacterium]